MIDSSDTVTMMLPVTGPMHLHFSCNAQVYAADLGQDLLGDWMVTQTWSGKFNRRGGGKTVLVEDLEAGYQLMQTIAAQQEKRGYRLILKTAASTCTAHSHI